MDDIKITLETLYDILRNEKKREELQNLENSFFIDVVSYLREKKAILEMKEVEDNLFAAGEREKLEYELKSIKRILKEIYEKREKKIIDVALNKSKTGSDIIDTSSMLREERDFYEKILNNLDKYRRGVLLNLFKGELPIIQDLGTRKPELKLPKEEAFANFEKDEESEEMQMDNKVVGNETDNHLESGESNQSIETDNNNIEGIEPNRNEKKYDLDEITKTKIKFTHAMPSFVWKDMKVYGPYDIGDEVDMFPEVADLIVRKGRAEKV
jgi:DNA replication initiation complex subunit (GINS family)